MTVLLVDPQALATARFALSPMAETVAALTLLAGRDLRGALDRRPARHPETAAALRQDRIGAALLDLLRTTAWLPDFLTPPIFGMTMTFDAELATVMGTPPWKARADLAVSLGGTLSGPLAADDAAERIGGLLRHVWTACVEADWPRRRAVLQRDIVHRAGLLVTTGWAEALAGLGPAVRWLGNGRLEVNTYTGPEQRIGRASLIFVPCGLGGGWLGMRPPDAYVVVYPARGCGAPDAPASTGGLSALIGPTRTLLLRSLDTPGSPSQLSALHGLSLGTVGAHLSILRAAGAVTAARTGRFMLYSRTALGDALLAGASENSGPQTSGIMSADCRHSPSVTLTDPSHSLNPRDGQRLRGGRR